MAASTLYWTGGAGDGNFMTAGNWNTQRDGGGSALAPGAGGAGDTLHIEATNQAISGGVTGISVAALNVSFGGSIGTPASPLNITVSGTLAIRTSGQNHYFAATNSAAIATTDIKETGSGTVYLAGPGACTTIKWGANCKVDIAANTAVTTARGAGGRMTAAYNSTVFTTLQIGAGTCESYRGATTAFVGPTADLKTLGAACVLTTVHIFGKHTNWSTAISGTSTIATVGTSICYPGGVATAKGSPYTPIITNSIPFEGSKHYLDSTNVVYTNDPEDVGQG